MTRESLEVRVLERMAEIGEQTLEDKEALEHIAGSLVVDLYSPNTGIHTVGEMLELFNQPKEDIIKKHSKNVYNGLKILVCMWKDFANGCRYMAMLHKRFSHILPDPPEDMLDMLAVDSDPYAVGINTDCDCAKCVKERNDQTSRVHKGDAKQNAPTTSARQ